MINGSCHCGKITFEISTKPAYLVSCNCSICRKLSALWTYSPPDEIKLNAPEGATVEYLWGDKGIIFHTCNTCGCTTHYTSVKGTRFAVNTHLAEPSEIKDLRIRHFDGADTWEFLD